MKKSTSFYSKNQVKKISNSLKEVYIFGIQPVLLNLKACKNNIVQIFLTKELEDKFNSYLAGIQIDIKTLKELDQIVNRLKLVKQGKINHQGIIGISRPPKIINIKTVLESDKVIILDDITDIGNIASISRTAAGFGFGTMIYKSRNMPDIAGNGEIYSSIVRLSSGGASLLNFYKTDALSYDLNVLKNNSYTIIGLDGFAIDNLSAVKKKIPLNSKIAIILGSEGKGLEKQAKNLCNFLAKLPMDEKSIALGLESFNVAIAGAMAMYELCR